MQQPHNQCQCLHICSFILLFITIGFRGFLGYFNIIYPVQLVAIFFLPCFLSFFLSFFPFHSIHQFYVFPLCSSSPAAVTTVASLLCSSSSQVLFDFDDAWIFNSCWPISPPPNSSSFLLPSTITLLTSSHPPFSLTT